MEHYKHYEHCGKPLKKNKIVWLELNIDDGKYYKNIEIKNSQGAFPFGKTCAKKILKENEA